MLFTTLTFIGFVALALIIYYAIPKKYASYRWIVLLVGNAVFYAFAGLKAFIYIGITIVSSYFAAVFMGRIYDAQNGYLAEHKAEMSREEKKTYKEQQKKKARKILVLALVLNFGLLAFLKYANFTIRNINAIIGLFSSSATGLSFMSLALPLGISFYTFMTMGYLIDVYRAKYAPEKNIFRLALFTSFFPVLAQGPIGRFDETAKTLFSGGETGIGIGKTKAQNLEFGFQRIVWGYFKKVVIADRVLTAVNALVSAPDEYKGMYVFAGMMLYAVRIYADFTGGIDITIGIAQAFGVELTENFDRPYFSKNIAEYWRRWHITLGTWFKEYLFYPISVSKSMLKLSKNAREKLGDAIGKRLPVYIATILVWFITGLWHGATWNFVMWGLANCIVILISQELNPLYKKFRTRFPKLTSSRAYDGFQAVRTVLLMSCLRMFDCYSSVGNTFRAFFSMFTTFNPWVLWNGTMLDLGLSVWDYVIVFAGVVLMFSVSLMSRRKDMRLILEEKPGPVKWIVFYLLVMVIIVFGAYGMGYDAGSFIYTQF